MFGAPKPATQPSFADGSSSKPGGFTFNTKTESKPFSFNASSTKPTGSPFSVSFGSTNAVSNTQTSTFGFNQPTAPTFGNSSTQQKPAFGVAPVTSNLFGGNNNQQASGFGASSSQATPTFGLTNPTQNSAANGMFNFGSAAAENKAGFSFGSSSSSTGSIGSSGSFNFGSAATVSLFFRWIQVFSLSFTLAQTLWRLCITNCTVSSVYSQVKNYMNIDRKLVFKRQTKNLA